MMARSTGKPWEWMTDVDCSVNSVQLRKLRHGGYQLSHPNEACILAILINGVTQLSKSFSTGSVHVLAYS